MELRDLLDLCREVEDSFARGCRNVERCRDLCLEVGDSAGVVSAEECIGDRGRKSRNLGLLCGCECGIGVDPESV